MNARRTLDHIFEMEAPEQETDPGHQDFARAVHAGDSAYTVEKPLQARRVVAVAPGHVELDSLLGWGEDRVAWHDILRVERQGRPVWSHPENKMA